MGFSQAAVLSSVSFFLGVLFICFNVDYRVLYALDEQAITDGFQFYTTFFNSPPAIKAMLHAMMGVGVVALISKISKWDESALFFDGSSLAAFIFSIAMFFAVTIPSMRTIVDPVPDVDTRQDQIEALQVLGAGNTIIIVLLTAVIALQAGQEYARRVEQRELQKIIEEEKKEAAGGADKKEQ
ncbi:hypothetical protein JAAARDRAFT_515241 [Jaapia argillacea MUCL 33604]|uniref:Shr3 amino acid permease chaperone n=1 Tax=Jaapia argillacea MUCL 33604 TaxID=933084 RepID=A0A067QDN7_9AGAM|nr:hypothetical protein JAAARDRAFT_515241 [Jaapia argillacea MUCL 33604]